MTYLPVEQWLDILQNMRTFALNPKHVYKRFTVILEACRQNLLPDKEQIQYIRATISEREKQEIAEVYLERGIEQGIEQGIEMNKKDMAKRMLGRGYEASEITELTELPIEEISQL